MDAAVLASRLAADIVEQWKYSFACLLLINKIMYIVTYFKL